MMIGVRADGRKELVALTDGYRESAESWGDLLRDCRRRGMTAPVPAIGDGALGFCKAVHEVFPETRQQRCWFHKQANVTVRLRTKVTKGSRTWSPLVRAGALFHKGNCWNAPSTSLRPHHSDRAGWVCRNRRGVTWARGRG